MSNNKSSDNILAAGEEEMTLGGRLYVARRNVGMSLNLVSSLLGVKSSTLKSWENDRSEPRINKLVALAGLLGVSPTHFLAEEGHHSVDESGEKGRCGKLVKFLKEEMSYALEEQKQLNKRLRKIDGIIQKLQEEIKN